METNNDVLEHYIQTLGVVNATQLFTDNIHKANTPTEIAKWQQLLSDLHMYSSTSPHVTVFINQFN